MPLAFNRTIESPGVEIRELDYTLNAGLPVGTSVLVAGYAPQGPSDELLNITSITEFEQLFGVPTDAAERYFYHTCRQVLLKNGNLLATRLPYGSGDGAGFGTEYSALVYPVYAEGGTEVAVITSTSGFYLTGASVLSNYSLTSGGQLYNTNLSAVVTGIQGFATQFSTASGYYIAQPTQITMSEYEYDKLVNGQITWKDLGGVANLSGGTISNAFSYDDIGKAGLVVVNAAKRTTNEMFEGQYVIFADNTKLGFGTDYDSVRNFETVTKANPSDTCLWSPLASSTLNFETTGQYMNSSGTTSEIMESMPGYQFGSVDFQDSLVMGVLKLRTTPFAADGKSTTLDQLVTESYIGSLWSRRQIQNRNGGPLETFFIEDIVNKSANVKVLVNPYISKMSSDWLDGNNNLNKVVRIYAPARSADVHAVPQNDTALSVVLKTYNRTTGTKVNDFANYADNGYAVGPYLSRSLTSVKQIGNVSGKVEKALRLAENPDEVPLDIVCEAGLGTIDTFVKVASACKGDSASNYYSLYSTWQGEYRDDVYMPGVQVTLGLTADNGDSNRLIDQDYGGTNNGITGRDSTVANEYQAVFQQFSVFCEFVRRPGTLFISDPLRHALVQGNRPVLNCRDTDGNKFNFPEHIYWGLRNLYSESNTSYACTYANWVMSQDVASDQLVWLPFSGFAAGIMCDTDRNYFPWFAPAGLNRGRITDVVEISINPTLKQRDLLYRLGLNPVVFFPQDGFVVWGQKTLFKKPSAFDRINVRRLFLVLEKATVAVARYFVFEPNTIFTRTRLIDAIRPIFERAKSNEGLYDYLIICDERNNTPDVIDRNELAVDIYLKPVRAAEFILISFIATRTGQDFSELV